jgi:hypothetical protein
MLLAGFTDVFVTGILTRCIRVRASPIAMPANPFGARSSVAPRIYYCNRSILLIVFGIPAALFSLKVEIWYL